MNFSISRNVGHCVLEDAIREWWHPEFYLVELGGQMGEVYQEMTSKLGLDFKYSIVERPNYINESRQSFGSLPHLDSLDYCDKIPTGADLLYTRSSAQYRSTLYSEIIDALPKYLIFYEHPICKSPNSDICQQSDGYNYRKWYKIYTIEETNQLLSANYTLQASHYINDQWIPGPGDTEIYNLVYKRND